MDTVETNGAPRSSWIPLRAATIEARAFARVASLLFRDRETCLPSQAKTGDDVVVLVHGLFATAGVMRPLREHLERTCGVHAASFTHLPGVGVSAIGQAIGDLVSQVPDGVRVHLVGHSLGGLAVRYYVQEVGADPRIAQTVCVATPFSGARGAFLMPGQSGRDIRAGSALLQRLRETAERAAHIPHLSIFGTADTAVPLTTTFFVGERVVVEAGHNGLLFDPRVLALIEGRVRAFGGGVDAQAAARKRASGESL